MRDDFEAFGRDFLNGVAKNHLARIVTMQDEISRLITIINDQNLTKAIISHETSVHWREPFTYDAIYRQHLADKAQRLARSEPLIKTGERERLHTPIIP